MADARAQLEAMQLVVTVGEAQFSDTVPIDGVVSVDPPAASSIERGATVTIVPSKGVDLVVMPDLTGMLLPQAQATLNAAGLNVGSLLGVTTGTFVSARWPARTLPRATSTGAAPRSTSSCSDPSRF